MRRRTLQRVLPSSFGGHVCHVIAVVAHPQMAPAWAGDPAYDIDTGFVVPDTGTNIARVERHHPQWQWPGHHLERRPIGTQDTSLAKCGLPGLSITTTRQWASPEPAGIWSTTLLDPLPESFMQRRSGSANRLTGCRAESPTPLSLCQPRRPRPELDVTDLAGQVDPMVTGKTKAGLGAVDSPAPAHDIRADGEFGAAVAADTGEQSPGILAGHSEPHFRGAVPRAVTSSASASWSPLYSREPVL